MLEQKTPIPSPSTVKRIRSASFLSTNASQQIPTVSTVRFCINSVLSTLVPRLLHTFSTANDAPSIEEALLKWDHYASLLSRDFINNRVKMFPKRYCESL